MCIQKHTQKLNQTSLVLRFQSGHLKVNEKTSIKRKFYSFIGSFFHCNWSCFCYASHACSGRRKMELNVPVACSCLAVDGIDGPLARHFDVKKNAPRFDGNLLDLIIDYLTYVFIPAFALFKSGLLPGWTGWFVIIIITFSSAMYFCDSNMKTKDNSFQGFPGCWNMVILVLFAIKPSFWLIIAIVAILALSMFLQIKFIHPVRTVRWRIVSLPTALLWTGFGAWAAWVNFDNNSLAIYGLIFCSLYLILAGALQQVFPSTKK